MYVNLGPRAPASGHLERRHISQLEQLVASYEGERA
jgi:hypothetical protein